MAVAVTERNGKYRLQYMYKGTRHSKTIPKCSKTALEKERAKFMIEVETESNPTCILFSVFAEKWLNEYAKNKVTDKTYDLYEKYLDNYILDFFDGYRLVDITAYDLTRFFNTLSHLTTSTIKKYRAFLSIMFNTAIKWDFINVNPLLKADLPKGQPSKTKKYFLSSEEAKKMLSCLETEPLKYRVIINIALKCGLRRSEILGLTWNNIDFDNKTITIDKTLSYRLGHGMRISDTKNYSSKRTIHVSDDVLELIKQLPKTQDLLFGIINIDAVSRWFKRFLKRYNLPDMRFHDLRHSNATILLANNIDITTVSKRLGHSQVSTTLNIYSHSLDSEDVKASTII